MIYTERLIKDYDFFQKESLIMVKKIAVLMTKEISDEPIEADRQMREAEGSYWFTLTLMGCANYWLDMKELAMLPDKSEASGLSELERKVTLQQRTANVRYLLNLLKNQSRALEQRINVCQSHLNFKKEHHTSG